MRIPRNIHFLYLALSFFGGAITFYLMLKGTLANGGAFNVIDFIQSTWVDNFYAKSLTFDFWTGAIAGTLFVMLEGIRLKMNLWWVYVLFIVLIGFAFGFPLFLFVRHKRMYLNMK
jgi:hypothetical protein